MLKKVNSDQFSGTEDMIIQLLSEQTNSTFWLCQFSPDLFILYDLFYYQDGAKPVCMLQANSLYEAAAIREVWQSLDKVGDRAAVHHPRNATENGFRELDNISLFYPETIQETQD